MVGEDGFAVVDGWGGAAGEVFEIADVGGECAGAEAEDGVGGLGDLDEASGDVERCEFARVPITFTGLRSGEQHEDAHAGGVGEQAERTHGAKRGGRSSAWVERRKVVDDQHVGFVLPLDEVERMMQIAAKVAVKALGHGEALDVVADACEGVGEFVTNVSWASAFGGRSSRVYITAAKLIVGILQIEIQDLEPRGPAKRLESTAAGDGFGKLDGERGFAGAARSDQQGDLARTPNTRYKLGGGDAIVKVVGVKKIVSGPSFEHAFVAILLGVFAFLRLA